MSKAPDDGYDGYYNDVQPIDSSELSEQMDPALMKQIIILLAGAAAWQSPGWPGPDTARWCRCHHRSGNYFDDAVVNSAVPLCN